MPNPPDTNILRAQQEGITRLVERDLTSFWGSLDLSKPESARNALMKFVPNLTDVYGEAAASVSADWYDDQRAGAGVRSRFSARAAEPTKAEMVAAQVRFGSSHLFTDTPGGTLDFLTGAASKYALAPGRETIMSSSLLDPAAHGWRRVTRPGSCGFCQMLQGRGGVYKESTAHFKSHGACHCVAVPEFDSVHTEADPVQYMASKADPTEAEQAIVREQIALTEAMTAETPPATAGNLTREQYEAMSPESTWTTQKREQILEALRSTPNGKILADTLDKFQDGGSIARLRTTIEKRLAGETLPAMSAQRADAVVDALRHAPTDLAPDTLYRGMSVKGKLENVLAKYKVGETLDLNLTSFTTDRKIATKFQSLTGSQGATRVMVEFTGADKRLLPIQNLARDRRLFAEKEWVGGGRYRISEVKKSPSGGIILRITQEEPL